LADPANRLPKAVERTAPLALNLYTLVVVWLHQAGHGWVRFPWRPWYRQKQEPAFADLLTTLRRVRYEAKTATLRPKGSGRKAWFSQLTEYLSRAG
jgi:hypothetical protein